MNRDEQKRITEFIERSVQEPGVVVPVDIEADAIIRALFVRNPEAAYRITMLAMGQVSELDTYRMHVAESHARMRRGWFSRWFGARRASRPEPVLPPLHRLSSN